MKPIILKRLIEQEVYYPTNIFIMLADIEKESPFDYNVLCNFFQKCETERKRIETLKAGNNDETRNFK